MALTFITTPARLQPSKNKAEYIVETDNMYQIPPSTSMFAILVLKVKLDPIHNSSFSLVLGDPALPNPRVLTFVFNDSPDDSGLQLPTNIGGDFMDDYVQNGIIANGLYRNYFLRNLFDITVQNGSSSEAEILFKAKNTGPEYTLIYNSTIPSSIIQDMGITPGTSPFKWPNFRILLDVFKTQSLNDQTKDRKIFGVELSPDKDGRCVVDLRRVLTDETSYNIPPFSGPILSENTGPISYYIMAAESYGDIPLPRAYERSPSSGFLQYSFHGALLNSRYPFATLHAEYMSSSTVKIMTNMISGKAIVHRKQKQYLSIYANGQFDDPGTYKIQGRILYTDNTIGSWSDWHTITMEGNRFITFRAGYTDLDIASKKIAGKTVRSYSLRVLRRSTVISEEFTFLLENDETRHPRFFTFINAFGMPESVYFYGEREDSIDFTSATVRNENVGIDVAAKIIHGEFEHVDNEFIQNFEIGSGNRPNKYHVDYLVEFINSPVKYSQEEDHYQKVILNKGSLKLYTDNDSVYSLRLTYNNAQVERGGIL